MDLIFKAWNLIYVSNSDIFLSKGNVVLSFQDVTDTVCLIPLTKHSIRQTFNVI